MRGGQLQLAGYGRKVCQIVRATGRRERERERNVTVIQYELAKMCHVHMKK